MCSLHFLSPLADLKFVCFVDVVQSCYLDNFLGFAVSVTSQKLSILRKQYLRNQKVSYILRSKIKDESCLHFVVCIWLLSFGHLKTDNNGEVIMICKNLTVADSAYTGLTSESSSNCSKSILARTSENVLTLENIYFVRPMNNSAKF